MSDPVRDWTCWEHNLQVGSNSDTPQMPLRGRKKSTERLRYIFCTYFTMCRDLCSVYTPMLELRLLRGLAQVTELKKILSCEYSRVTSFPLKIYAEAQQEINVRLAFKLYCSPTEIHV